MKGLIGHTKRVGVISTAALVLLLGIPALGYSQEGQQRDQQGRQDKQSGPNKQRGKRQRGTQQQRDMQQQGGQQQSQDYYRQQPQDTQRQQSQDRYGYGQRPQDTQWQQSQDRYGQRPQRTQWQSQDQRRQQRVWQDHRAGRWNSEHRTWRQRGGYDGYLVPNVYFRSHYGPSHSFRVYSCPFRVVGGRPRFQYGNHWFTMVDPYPEYWGSNWYQTDDVYVEYVHNGYYLFNRNYPQRTGIAISIAF